MVVPNVSLSQVREAMATLYTIIEQQYSNDDELNTKLLAFQKSIIVSCIQESHQRRIIYSYFGH